jgi:hypothetical protein
MTLAAEFGTGQVLLSMIYFFLFVIWIYLLIVVFSDIFRSADLGGWAKALWVIFVIVLPYLGVLVYFIARGSKMSEHATQAAQAQGAQQLHPERSRFGRKPRRGTHSLAGLRDKGVISGRGVVQPGRRSRPSGKAPRRGRRGRTISAQCCRRHLGSRQDETRPYQQA